MHPIIPGGIHHGVGATIHTDGIRGVRFTGTIITIIVIMIIAGIITIIIIAAETGFNIITQTGTVETDIIHICMTITGKGVCMQIHIRDDRQ